MDSSGHTHWNPGLGGAAAPAQQPQEVWSSGNDCLMGVPVNVNVNSDVGSMFGYPLVRFQGGPQLHFGQLHSHHHVNVNVGDVGVGMGLHQHQLVQHGGEEGDGTGGVGVQEGVEPNGLGSDWSEENTDEEDEDGDEVVSEEEQLERAAYVQHNQQLQLSVPVPNSTLPSCQQQSRLIEDQGPCHRKGGIVSHVHELEEEIPAITDGHPLNSNPISAIPMITDGCNQMMMQDEGEVVANGGQQQGGGQAMNMGMGMNGAESSSCNSTWHSVHGKMYVEEKVLFHLRQWSDSGFGGFNSCREQQQKNYGCTVCHIRSPYNTIQQKDTHRHAVRGFFCSFEDRIILELYPELEHYNETDQTNDPNNSLTLEPKQSIALSTNKDADGNGISYYTANNMVLTESNQHQHALEKPTAASVSHEHNSESGWWNYESRDVEERHDDLSGGMAAHHSSAVEVNPKLTAQQFHDSQADALDEIDSVPIAVSLEGNEKNNTAYHTEPSTSSASFFSVNIGNHEVADEYAPGNSNGESTPGRLMLSKLEPDSVNRFEDTSGTVIQQPSSQSAEPLLSVKRKALKKTESSSTSASKYSCPCCSERFTLKRFLKDHLQENHESGNPYQCPSCKTQYTDTKRLSKHSCSISLEGFKNGRKGKDVAIESSQEEPTTDKGLNVPPISNQSLPLTENCAANCNPELSSNETEEDIDKLLLASNSSKVRKFSEKKRIKFSDSDGDKRTSESNDGSTIGSSCTNSMQMEEDLENQDLSEDLNSGSTQNVRSVARTASPDRVTTDEDNMPAGSASTTKEFSCTDCGKEFATYKRLLNHSVSHRPERKVQCDQCGKSFARRDKLLRHMYVHSEEKMFSCDICDKRFSRRDKLADHLKSHQADEIHKCPMCERQFVRPDILKQHVKTHQMEDKHQCPECLRFVTGKERLIQHMKRHEDAKTSGEPVECHLCEKQFIQHQSLKAHVRKFHKEVLRQNNLDARNDGRSEVHEEETQGEGRPTRKLVARSNSADFPSGSGSDSNSSCDQSINTPQEPPPEELKIVEPPVINTPVIQFLETVMTSKAKPGSSSKRKGNTEKTVHCDKCSESFPNKKALKDHECKRKKVTAKRDQPAEPREPAEVSETRSKLKRRPAGDNEKTKKSKSRKKENRDTKIEHGKSTNGEVPKSADAATVSTIQLPSCSSLSQDIKFGAAQSQCQTSSSQSQQQLSAYSQYLAAAAGRGINIPGLHLQNPCLIPADTMLNGSHLHNPQLQPMGSIQLLNAGSGIVQSATLINPSSAPYVISYPTTSTVCYQED